MRATSWHDFRVQASRKPARLALADGNDPRVIEAAARALADGIADPVLIGARPQAESLWKTFSKARMPRLDPAELPAPERKRLTRELLTLRKFKSLSPAEAEDRLKDPLIFGCLLLRTGQVEGFVGGATRTTADTLKAVFSIVGLAPDTATLFGFFLIEKHAPAGENPLVLLADCAVTPEPSSKQLANIAIGAAAAFEYFTGDTARIALLSFSTHGSAEHETVKKVQDAVLLARTTAPAAAIEGEWQADAALDPAVARMKGVGDSPLAGKANVLIAPDLNCGNIAYKLLQRVGRCRSVGPVLWGTALPANDLSRGCSADDVLDMLALTTLQTQKTLSLEKSAHAR